MLKIGEFFKRIQGAFAKEVAFRMEVQRIVKEFTSLQVPIEAISMKSASIRLKNISQSARSEIYIKKKSILDSLNKAQDIYRVEDIS